MAVAIIIALCGFVHAQTGVRAGKTATGISYDVQGSGPVVVLLTGSNLDRRTSLVGLSAGSTIVLDAALEHPSRVERIVLSGPAPSGYVSKTRPAFVGDLGQALQARDYKKAAEVLLGTPVFAAPRESHALVRQMVMENDRLWTVSRDLMRGPPRNAVDRLDQVRVPTLVLIGELDALQREPAELLGTNIPGARFVVIPGGGHLLNLTSPKAFEAAVSSFLK